MSVKEVTDVGVGNFMLTLSVERGIFEGNDKKNGELWKILRCKNKDCTENKNEDKTDKKNYCECEGKTEEETPMEEFLKQKIGKLFGVNSILIIGRISMNNKIGGEKNSEEMGDYKEFMRMAFLANIFYPGIPTMMLEEEQVMSEDEMDCESSESEAEEVEEVEDVSDLLEENKDGEEIETKKKRKFFAEKGDYILENQESLEDNSDNNSEDNSEDNSDNKSDNNSEDKVKENKIGENRINEKIDEKNEKIDEKTEEESSDSVKMPEALFTFIQPPIKQIPSHLRYNTQGMTLNIAEMCVDLSDSPLTTYFDIDDCLEGPEENMMEMGRDVCEGSSEEVLYGESDDNCDEEAVNENDAERDI